MKKQCSSCGGFCGNTCKRENVAKPEQEPSFWLSTLDVETKTPIVISHADKTQGSIYADTCIYPFYTTPSHSFFEDVADELRVEIAELQDHIRLLEKQLAQPQRTAAEGEDTRRAWVGLTHSDIDQGLLRSNYAMKTAQAWRDGVYWAQTKLKEKNT